MIAVVIKARKRKKGKGTVKSQYNVEGEPLEGKVSTDNVDTYDYIRDQPTPRPRQDENTYDYATAENIFINPASATASFNTHVYNSATYSEVVERTLAAGEEGNYEEARAEVSSGDGRCHEEPVRGTCGKQKDSDVKNVITKVEDLYAQPDKLTKKRKIAQKDTQDNTTEEVAAPCDDLYAKPDMTKKKYKRSQQHWEQETEERKPVPTAPVPYKMHKEEKQESLRDNGADIPDEPSLHVSDEEQ